MGLVSWVLNGQIGAVMAEMLEKLTAGQIVPFGGDKVARVSDELAAAFRAGDRLIVTPAGDLLHVPAAVQAVSEAAISMARAAFADLASVSDAQISRFFDLFAAKLSDDAIWSAIAAANTADVEAARARSRSTTRLVADAKMRKGMIEGLRQWRDAPPSRGRVIEHIDHQGWSVDQVAAPLGVVGFVFEGRPNVFADATGVLRTGNTVAFRIGSDALGTARAIVAHALRPALLEAGLPEGAAMLVDSAERSAGWAMFSNPGLALAVARGSGPAVAQLGAVARQAGTPVSLHGTGGAWIVADETADAARFAAVVEASLDRKVCNTLNVCCIVQSRASDLVPVFLDAIVRAGEALNTATRLHVAEGSQAHVPDAWFEGEVTILRAEGPGREPAADVIPEAELATEWEWEGSPEVTLVITPDVAAAVDLFNRYSPQFTASLISEDAAAQEAFWQSVNAPFVGDGFTRWVDGQYALNRPELGLSNWENGRLFARGAVLSGDGVFTVRTRVRQSDPKVRR